MKIGKQVLETGKEILIALGVHNVLKEKAAEAFKVHFAGIGKNDERIFATELLKLDPAEHQTIKNFLATKLEDWQQIQFILFVAGMPGPTAAQPGRKGQPPTAAKPGDRQPFLKGLVALPDHDERMRYLEQLNVFSPVSISRLFSELQKGFGLPQALKNLGWQPNWQSVRDGFKKFGEDFDDWLGRELKKSRRRR